MSKMDPTTLALIAVLPATVCIGVLVGYGTWLAGQKFGTIIVPIMAAAASIGILALIVWGAIHA